LLIEMVEELLPLAGQGWLPAYIRYEGAVSKEADGVCGLVALILLPRAS
jgi:hypothetical protein